jgi:hypothetical protein
MSAHALGRLERGERGMPSLAEIRAWAPALQVDESVLTDLRGSEPVIHASTGAADPPGGVQVHTSEPAVLADLLAHSSRSVVIWQTWLLVDMGLREALRSAVRNGSVLRVIVLDPTSAAAIGRAQALGYREPVPYLRANLAKVIGDLDAIGAEPGAVVRLSATMPPAPVYGTEARVLVGWYLPDGPSTVRPQVEVDARSPLAVAMMGAFDREWGRLGPADLGSYA